MPCNSDYMNPTNTEIEASRIMCLLDEISGVPFNDKEWEGYHDEAYGKSINLDKLVSTLCEKIQNINVKKYSLELQLWARNHKDADKKRLKRELEEMKTANETEAALAKLTPYERKLLRLN